MIEEILSYMDEEIQVVEYGALDDLSLADIRELEPQRREIGIATTMRDGTNVAISESWLRQKVLELCADHGRSIADLTVIASTGVFDLGTTNPHVIHAQNVLDEFMEALIIAGQKIGQIRPLPGQVAASEELKAFNISAVYAPTGDETALISAAQRLTRCDFVVLNSVGYSGRDRDVVAEASGKPVIQMRRMLAGTLGKALKQGRKMSAGEELLEGSALRMRLTKLTRREYQVFDLLVKGLANKEIASELGISPRTVEIHRARMLAKMGVSTGGELMRLIVQNISRAKK